MGTGVMTMGSEALGRGSSRLGAGLIWFCGIGLMGSALLKFLGPAKVLTYLRFLGYEQPTVSLIAAIELLVAVLFLVRFTRPAGLLLLSAYFGGAISAHLANHPLVAGGPFLMFTANHHYLSTLPADVFLASAWIGTWLAHREMLQRI